MVLSLAVDIGGTFTDLFAIDHGSGQIYQAKVLSTPPNFSDGVLHAIDKSGLDLHAVDNFVHGTTVAINTAIERTGAPTALVVTGGTRDVYKIGRGNRPDAYDIFFRRAEPLAPARSTFEVTQRTSAWGECLTPFDESQAREVVRRIADSGAEAVAICFLHSYADDSDERRMASLLREALDGRFVCASHEITRKYGEYERMSTTVLNSYVGPRTSSYLARIEEQTAERAFDGRFLIMQSNGGLMSADVAKRMPVAMMESGPVGGVIAAAHIAAELGYTRSIAFDMGGTTAKASLIQGREPAIADGYYIGGYASGHPAMLPVVDIEEVGTGGGSIAWVDEVGALNVGPRSAGADPGPICYGRGGVAPTVTDADVVLGRIGATSFLGGEMDLDVAKAREAIAALGEPFGLDADEAALSIVKIAIAKMSLAVRGVSVERGFDPRDFALVATGGGGPVHAVAIAKELHIPEVIIPVLPAHFSACGMLLADFKHDYVRTFYIPWDAAVDLAELKQVAKELVAEGFAVMAQEGVATDRMSFQAQVDIRYAGQEFTLPVDFDVDESELSLVESVARRFHELHDTSYGHAAPDEHLECVSVRVTTRSTRDKFRTGSPGGTGEPLNPVGRKPICLDDPSRFADCPVYRRELLAAGDEIVGPAVIEEYGSTTLIFAEDIVRVAPAGELIIKVGVAE